MKIIHYSLLIITFVSYSMSMNNWDLINLNEEISSPNLEESPIEKECNDNTTIDKPLPFSFGEKNTRHAQHFLLEQRILNNILDGNFLETFDDITDDYISAASHANHFQEETLSSNCPITPCNKKLLLDGSLCLHIINQHLDKNSKACPFTDCNYHYKSKQALPYHIRATHTGEKPYKCQCGKTFYQKGDLTRHARVHSGERPYSCPCGQTFSNVSGLKRHKKIHLGKKNHICEVCELSFFQISNLVRHQRVHTGQRPYKCECGESFSQLQNLHQHQTTHL